MQNCSLARNLAVAVKKIPPVFPQVLKRDIYLISLAAALKKDIRSTDETTIAELAGFRVDYVDIGTYNFKLTDAADVKRAKAMIFLESRGML